MWNIPMNIYIYNKHSTVVGTLQHSAVYKVCSTIYVYTAVFRRSTVQ